MEQDDTNTEFIDGGFGVNCPSELVYRSIEELGDDDPQSVRALVSIGTGKPPQDSRRKEAIVKFSDSNLRWILRLINSALKQTTNAETIHLRVEDQLRKDKVPYFRLNVEEGLSNIKLDAFKGKNGEKTLGEIIDSTKKYLTSNEEVRDKFDKLAKALFGNSFRDRILPRMNYFSYSIPTYRKNAFYYAASN